MASALALEVRLDTVAAVILDRLSHRLNEHHGHPQWHAQQAEVGTSGTKKIVKETTAS
jgi:hypothetical protein